MHITAETDALALSNNPNPWRDGTPTRGTSRSSTDSFDGPEHSMTNPSSHTASDARAHLIYCKSHVYIHPSAHSKDNIPGILGLAGVPAAGGPADAVRARPEKVILFWIPQVLAETLGERERYSAWEERVGAGVKRAGLEGGLGIKAGEKADPADDEGRSRETRNAPSWSLMAPLTRLEYVFVTLPSPSEGSPAGAGPRKSVIDPAGYAFSVPLSQVYSLLVYPPSLGSWYGSVTVKCAVLHGSKGRAAKLIYRLLPMQHPRRHRPLHPLLPRRRVALDATPHVRLAAHTGPWVRLRLARHTRPPAPPRLDLGRDAVLCAATYGSVL